jgi:hypothetical protein
MRRQSGGKLPLFVEGIRALASGLSPGDRVLIAEACNHNRITDHCNDIGMVQIPNALTRVCGKGLVLEHAFGRCVNSWIVCLCSVVQSRNSSAFPPKVVREFKFCVRLATGHSSHALVFCGCCLSHVVQGVPRDERRQQQQQQQRRRRSQVQAGAALRRLHD